MSEKNFKNQVIKNLKKIGMLTQKIESSTAPGIPDLFYSNRNVCGWIEFKYIIDWPKKSNSIVPIKITNHQKLWIKKWDSPGCHVFLMLKIAQDSMIFNSHKILCINSYARRELVECALQNWHKRTDYQELFKILTN